MKKIIIAVVFMTVLSSASVFSKTGTVLNNIFYKQQHWEFDLGIPKNNYVKIVPQNKNSRECENGYVRQAEENEKSYNIIFLYK